MRKLIVSVIESQNDTKSSVLNSAPNFEYFASKTIIASFWLRLSTYPSFDLAFRSTSGTTPRLERWWPPYQRLYQTDEELGTQSRPQLEIFFLFGSNPNSSVGRSGLFYIRNFPRRLMQSVYCHIVSWSYRPSCALLVCCLLLFICFLLFVTLEDMPLTHTGQAMTIRLGLLTRQQLPQHPDLLVETSGALYICTAEPDRSPFKSQPIRSFGPEVPNASRKPRPQRSPLCRLLLLVLQDLYTTKSSQTVHSL